VLFGLEHAAEGFGDGVAFEVRGREGRRGAGGEAEHIHEFEDEEAGEGAAEVAYAENQIC